MAHIIAASTANTPNTIILDGSQSTDANGDTLTYIWRQTSGIEVALVNPQQAISQFKVDALPQDEVVSFKLTVFDGQVIDQQEISITLKANTQAYLDQQQDQNTQDQQDNNVNNPDSEVVAEITVKKGAGSNSLWLLLMLAGFMGIKRRK